HAPVIGVIGTVLQHAHDGSDNGWAVFDAGAAWMAMTLQARMLGLYTHGMAGVHFDAAYEALGIDRETTQVVCAFALGHVGEAGSLPEALAEREAPSPRKSLESIWTPVTV
ncbi:MAG: nitroreductase family protein, partial [Pseudomonadota bacterium]